MQIGKTVAFVEGKLMAEDGTVLATADEHARLVETREGAALGVLLLLPVLAGRRSG